MIDPKEMPNDTTDKNFVQNVQSFNTFSQSLRDSIQRANADYFLLLRSIASACLFILLHLLGVIIIFALSYFLKGQVRLALMFVGLIYAFFVFMKFNGALGLTLAYITMGRTDAFKIGREASDSGARFFINAASTGLLLMFGQVVMICPCFILLSNFIFSPYLFAYEGLRGKKAEARSVELARGFGWIVLGRTMAVIGIGYLTFVLIALMFLTKYVAVALVLLIFINLYFGLMQAHFIRDVYENTLRLAGSGQENPAGRTKALTMVAVVAIILFYILIKLWPHFFHN